jgi:hypothetical protein
MKEAMTMHESQALKDLIHHIAYDRFRKVFFSVRTTQITLKILRASNIKINNSIKKAKFLSNITALYE